MPKDKFYPSTAVESKPSDHLAVEWQRDIRSIGTVFLTMTVGDSVAEIDSDRSGLNRLIRTLRKARDQTYGADE